MFRRFYRKRYFKCMLVIFAGFVFWSFTGYMYSAHNEDFPEENIYDMFVDEENREYRRPLDHEMREELSKSRNFFDDDEDLEEREMMNPSDPIILWWTVFTREPGVTRSCGQHKCFFTNDRRYRDHENTQTFLFYGTDFSIDNLPLPRNDDHIWALLHEESPKNNYLLSHEDVLSLFNYTSTFRRESDFPLSTQYLPSLDWLEQTTFMQTAKQKSRYQEEEGLAPVVYVQSDCDPPSDRDEFVKLLMNYISVDSYGNCLNNRKLPQKLQSPVEGMADTEFFKLMSRYKFSVAMENAVCPDYMTEKLWRSLMLGNVPIVFGSSKVRDFLPSNHSALLLQDFKSAEHLAMFIQHLNNDNTEYDRFREWKKSGVSNDFLHQTLSRRKWAVDGLETWKPGDTNFVDGFECFVCEKVHKLLQQEERGEELTRKWADKSHYGCPKPMKFDEQGRYQKEGGWLDFWSAQWEREKEVAASLKECVQKRLPYCGQEYLHQPEF